MAKLAPLLLWSAAIVFVAAPFADRAVNTLVLNPSAPRVTDLDANVRVMGGVGAAFESAGDAVAPGQTHRDLTFYLDEPRNVEIIIEARATPLTIEMYDTRGALTGSTAVSANGSAILIAAGSAGDRNRIRVNRTDSIDESAPFGLRMRSYPLPKEHD